jgi:exodeoxyribonuclease V gamma subunit
VSYRLYQTNRIEDFLDLWGDKFVKKDPFTPPLWTIVQNRNMGEWLKLKLADSRGISFGFESLYPEQAIRYFVDFFDHPWKKDKQEKTVLFMDNLKVVLFKKLEEINRKKDISFDVLLEFLTDDKSIYEVANVLAGLFYSYGMNCFDLVSYWDRGEAFQSDKGRVEGVHEIWQRHLWMELFGEHSPYILLSQILTHISKEELPFKGDEKRIILFGSSFLGDGGLTFFSHLSRFIHVDHFLMTPSQAYLAESKEKIHEDWENLTPLIKGVIEYFREKKVPQLNLNSHGHDDFPLSLLGRVQKSLWQNNFSSHEGYELFTNSENEDDSFLVFSAMGNWRQVEGVKNKIISLLNEDKTLQLNDIALMAPDINDFSPYIEALFKEGDNPLPYNFIDLKNDVQSAYLEGFTALLELPGSRFSREEIFGLIKNPCFAQAFGIDSQEGEEWMEYVRETGIFWGVDTDHLKRLDFPVHQNNRWERGFERLLDGMLYFDQKGKENFPVVYPDESRNVSVGNLIHGLRSLYDDFFSLFEQKMTLEQWVPRIENLMEFYLQPRHDNRGDAIDRERIKGVFRNINNLIEGLDGLSAEKDSSFSWYVFKTLLLELIGKNSLRKGGYLTNGISCSSLKPLRAVPFRVVILLGMDFGVFPGKDNNFSFDLTDLAKPTVDLSRRAGDRFSFLEVLASAREKLWIYYNGLSNINGRDQLPSAVITELLDLIQSHNLAPGRFEKIVIREPLQPFDQSYFLDEKNCSPDHEAYRQAVALKEGTGTKEGSRVSLAIDREMPIEITLKELIQFYHNPLETYGKKALRLYFNNSNEEKDESLEDIDLKRFYDDILFRDLLDSWLIKGVLASQDFHSYFEQWWHERVTKGELSGYSWDRPARESLYNQGLLFIKNLNQIDRTNIQSLRGQNRIFNGEEGSIGDSRYAKMPEVSSKYGTIRLSGETGLLYGDDILTGTNYYYGEKPGSKTRIPLLLKHLFLSRINIDSYQGIQSIFASTKKTSIEGWAVPGKNRADYFRMVNEKEDPLTLFVNLYLDNLKNPIPFYPSLIDKAVEEIHKGKVDKDNLQAHWKTLWLMGLNGQYGFYDLKNCPYGKLFFTDPPPWDERMDDLFKTIVPLIT